MSLTHGKSTKVFWGGFNITTFLNSVGLSGKADTAETSTFGLDSKAYIAGLIDATLSVGGLYEPTATAGSDVTLLNAALGSAINIPISVYPQGDTLGLDGWGLSGFDTSLGITANLGAAVMIAGEAQSSVGAELLKSHHAHGAETAATNAASIDNAASSATGGVGYQHCTAFVGTNITLAIQDSADNSTFVDRLVFTAITAANSKERKTLTALASVARYTRCAWTGTFTSATFVVGFGRTPRAS